MTRIILLHNTHDQDMTNKNETHFIIALHKDPPSNQLIDVILVTQTDHAHIQETTTLLRYTHLPLDNLQDLEILDFSNLAHTQLRGINLIQYNHKLKMIQTILKYICITQAKWQTL